MKRLGFTELVDIVEVRRMLEAHQQVTGAVSAILDTEENILVAAGWQDVCTKFHRLHPEACKRCQESDAYLKDHLSTLEGDYLDYRCKNGLRDVAMPIIIAGQHVATFFTGQFFYDDEKPDEEYFRNQAREFGFDEESYLDAVRRAPVFTRDQVRHTMRFFSSLVQMLGQTGLRNLELAQEVQERKQAEAALRRTEELMRRIFETIPDQLSLIDREYRTIHSNSRAAARRRCDLGGAPRSHPLVDASARPSDTWHLARVFETGAPVITEKYTPGMGFVEIRAYPVVDDTGAVSNVMEHIRDINEQRRVDEALRESEQRLRTTIERCAIPIFVIGKNRKIIFWNKALVQLTGTRAETVVGTQRGWRAFHRHKRPLLAELLVEGKIDQLGMWYGSRCSKSKLINEAYESTFFCSEIPGGGRWLHFTAAVLRDTRGNLIGAIETIEDITERTVAEEKWHSLYNNLPGGSYTVNEDRIIEDVNDVLCAITGYSRDELVGQPCAVICSNAKGRCHFHDRHEERLDNGEMALKAKNGSLIHIIKSARRIATGSRRIIVENFQDITEQKRLEEQLRHSQKMEAIGQLAGGVAHDFNNILTVILGNANLLRLKADQDAILDRHLNQIIKAAEKASHLTHGLLAFSRKHVVRLAAHKVDDILRKAHSLLSRLIPEDIELRFVAGGEYRVHVDSVQIEQVIMNLVTNARDAMPAGGTVTISTDEVELDERTARLRGQLEAGRYVRISVSDTGIGIPEEILQHLFEPFFTTKETGKGTGLGLSIVYAIVKQHKGYVTVESEPGEGSTFQVYLPCAAEPAAAKEAVAVLAPPRGSEVILLAEDEPMVRDLTRIVLEEFGYQVVLAEDGVEAVEKFHENRERIDLLILDVIMPRMNGNEAYQKIRELRPEVSVLFMSGYTGDYLSNKEGIEADFNFLAKPVAHDVLLQKIRKVLDARG